jgi:hypothetical protein
MKLWKKFPGLHVYTPSLEYLLVTKIMASRSKDRADVTTLAKKLRISKQRDILDLVTKYVDRDGIAPEVLDEIAYLFE